MREIKVGSDCVGNEGELCKVGRLEVWFCSMVKAPEEC